MKSPLIKFAQESLKRQRQQCEKDDTLLTVGELAVALHKEIIEIEKRIMKNIKEERKNK